MKLFRIDKETGMPIHHFGSKNLHITPIMRLMDKQPVQIMQAACLYLSEGGIVGGHEAPVPQFFIVIAGEGWVSGAEKVKTPIKEGQLAFWNSGEWHEVSTEKGMTAMVIESDQLEPMELLQELKEEEDLF